MKAVMKSVNDEWRDEITDDQHRRFLFQLQHGLLLALLECGSISVYEYRGAVKRLQQRLKLKEEGDDADQICLLLPRLDQ